MQNESQEPQSEQIIFERKEFLEFLQWMGVTGEYAIGDNGDESFCIFGNSGDLFSLDVCQQHPIPNDEQSIRQDEREKVLNNLKVDLKTRFVSSSNQWSKGRNSGLLECCNIIDEELRSGKQEAGER